MKQLAKLLGVGNSFFGGNQAVAYRLNKFCLPKFNAGKNPFTPKPTAEGPAAPKVEAKVAAPVVVRTQKISAQPVAKPAAKPTRVGWTAKLNPFRAPEPVAPTPVAVQPEFSLDTIKVVHNDLADADVEMVPVKSRADAPAVPVLPPARQAWEYLGESLMKSS